MKTQISIVSAVVLGGLVLAGCRKEEPQNPSAFAPTPAPTDTSTVAPTQTPAPPPAPSASTTAAPPTCDPAAATMLSAVLTPLQNVQAPGTKAVGSVCGVGQPGQVIEVPVTLQPGKCYTGIGGGLPPLTQIDLELSLTTVAGAPPVVLAASAAGGGVNPVLGGKPTCFKNPTPIAGAAVFRLKFTGGQGPAIATLYEK